MPEYMNRTLRQSSIIAVVTMMALSALACGSDAAGPTIRKDVMWDVSVFPQAISLPVSESLPLIVKPVDYDGQVIDTDVAITYESRDTSRVMVDSSGVITAKRNTAGGGIQIKVTIRAGLVTKILYVMVGVTETPVDVDSIAIRSAVGDPIIAVGSFGALRVQTFDSHGAEVFNVYNLIESVSQNGRYGACTLLGTSLLCTSPGKTIVRATVFVNGKLLSDTIEYRTRYREYADLSVSRSATGGLNTLFVSQYTGSVYLSPNAQVDFINKQSTPMDVVFDHPDNVKGTLAGAVGGDILELQPGKRVARWFPTTGDHFFTVRSGTDSRRISVTVIGSVPQ